MDASHVSEKSQVIASLADRRQSFQIVNMDVRIVYRIALDDAAALAATYRSADVPTLVRSTASRVLVHAFASRTLDEVLGEQRAGLAEQIGQAVQADPTASAAASRYWARRSRRSIRRPVRRTPTTRCRPRRSPPRR